MCKLVRSVGTCRGLVAGQLEPLGVWVQLKCVLDLSTDENCSSVTYNPGQETLFCVVRFCILQVFFVRVCIVPGELMVKDRHGWQHGRINTAPDVTHSHGARFVFLRMISVLVFFSSRMVLGSSS